MLSRRSFEVMATFFPYQGQQILGWVYCDLTLIIGLMSMRGRGSHLQAQKVPRSLENIHANVPNPMSYDPRFFQLELAFGITALLWLSIQLSLKFSNSVKSCTSSSAFCPRTVRRLLCGDSSFILSFK